ncbi:hypothetical protein OsI_25171 [Oryza sativa Indica Group]|uniref:Disease resistance R13L4/SHOC-2-like LRR domain-containing protein n=1 Tax=Oryza sativa subsp. indica TaxID=39946 RepID=A2YIW9_ORYSI|nr:hypothetical protein OsI_25171 [Oryza sativa Indica Group]
MNEYGRKAKEIPEAQMHDLVREIALTISKKEKIATIWDCPNSDGITNGSQKCQLFYLHYLNFGYTKLKDIPRLIGKLSNLQMLYLNGSVLELPSETTMLTKLHHLLVDVGRFGMSASSNISQLQHLQSLRSIEANSYMVKNIGCLTGMRSLVIMKKIAIDIFLIYGQLETSISPGEANDKWQDT